MALVIEAGTGDPSANSFVTIEQANAYLASVGATVWDGLTDTAKEQHLVLGARYVSNAQIYRYDGTFAVFGQALAWPRASARYAGGTPAVPVNAIPPEIKLGQILAAQASSEGKLPATNGGANSPREVKSESVGDLSVEYFQAGGTTSGNGTFTLANSLPSVTGVVYPLLDQEFYSDTATNAKRAPLFAPAMAEPAARAFWPDQFATEQGQSPDA